MEIKEVFEALGISSDSVKDLDTFKSEFQKTFISRSAATEDDEVRSKITGKLLGSLTTFAKNEFELDPSEIKEKKIEDVLKMASEKYKKKISDLEIEGKKTSEQAILDWQTKYEKARKESQEFKTQSEQAAQMLADAQKDFISKEKGWKINGEFSKVKEKLQSEYKSDISPLELEGFESYISKNYKFDIDETEGALGVWDKDGKRVQDPKQLNKFASPYDVLLSEAVKNNLVKKNNSGGKTTQIVTQEVKKEAPSVQPKRTLHHTLIK